MDNPIRDYRYAMQLFFDEASENLISSYISELRSHGLLNADFIPESYRPHISLAVYRDLQPAYAAEALQLLAARFAAFPLHFSHIGVFNEELKVLYLGPTCTTSLRDLHDFLHTLYRERPEQCLHYYLPGYWVPHCGLMIDSKPDPIAQGLHLLMNKTLPRTEVTSIAATGFPQPMVCPLNTEL